jgi:tRNA wybutosine-synthesizing protein 3
MTREKDFLDGKKGALEKLKKAINSNQVDPGIQQILNIINKSDDYYTTSSCFGRIVLLEIPSIGDKKEAKFLGKWHREIEVKEILSVTRKAKDCQIWLLSQSPIIHVGARSDTAADKILKTAISCGFKNSGLKSLGKKIVVEILSTERLDAPIGKNGKLFCNNEHLDLLVNISNEIMEKSTLKLKKLEDNLRKVLSS